jgi:hypothetical protein
MRKLAYRRYSEGRAAHWLILLAADRVDATESHLRSLATLHPDNPITQTGITTEFHRHGIDSRIGKHRADVVHQTMDPIIVAGPWLLAGGVVFLAMRSLIRSGGRRLNPDAGRRPELGTAAMIFASALVSMRLTWLGIGSARLLSGIRD